MNKYTPAFLFLVIVAIVAFLFNNFQAKEENSNKEPSPVISINEDTSSPAENLVAIAPIPEPVVEPTQDLTLPPLDYILYLHKKPKFSFDSAPYTCKEQPFPGTPEYEGLVKRYGDNGEYCYRENSDPGAGHTTMDYMLTTATETGTVTVSVSLSRALGCDPFPEEEWEPCEEAHAQWAEPLAVERLRGYLTQAPTQ